MAKDKQPEVVPGPEVKHWLDHISGYDREFKTWSNRVKKIVKIYRDNDRAASTANPASFNILWSNVQVVQPAVFARLPKPDVSRRFGDQDQVGRVAALILERGLSYEIEHYPDYRATMKNSVLDRFLGGRGTAWVRYEPHIVALPGQPADGVQVSDDADQDAPEQQEEIEYECAPTDYVNWEDFGHTLARTWEEVTGVWRKVQMNRAALVKRFGEKVGRRIPCDTKPDTGSTQMRVGDASGDASAQACIYEIWDKTTSEVLWLSKSLGEIVDRRPDPLRLENFWPCPRPLFATMTNDTLIPVPDYKLYQDQAKQLSKLAAKIDGLIDMLEVKGVYDAAIPELARLLKEAGNGDLIPVKSFQAFSEKMGLKGSIDILDITPIVAALNEAYTAVEAVKNAIYELMGISDIVRGSSDPRETLGAQKLKGQFGSMRLRSMQDDVVMFATELLQIKAQIMCQHFQPETLLRIAAADQLSPQDQQLIGPALDLLMGPRAKDPQQDTMNGPLAGFRVEVSSDSMVAMDEAQEKAERMEFLGAVSGFMEKALAVVQSSPQIAPLVVGLLKFGISGFKVGKAVEGMIDQQLEQLTKQAQQPQPEKPDPEMVKVQATAQAKQQELQMKAQLDAQHLENEKQIKLAEQQYQAQQNQHQQGLESQRAMEQAQLDAALERQRFESEERTAAAQRQLDLYKIDQDNATKIAVATIAANSKAAATEGGTEGEEGEAAAPADPKHDELKDMLTKLYEELSKPRTIERDPAGRAVSINGRPIQRDANGKLIGY